MTKFEMHIWRPMLAAAAASIEQQVPELNRLDSKIGDGDHGSTMHRVCHCIELALEQEITDWVAALDSLGWDIMSQDGGSAGMLVGNLFMGIAEGSDQQALSTTQWAQAFRSGLDRLSHFSGAKAGDKTMLDALIPAVKALEDEAGGTLREMFIQAALAAQQGAEATKAMVPTRGRAKNVGEKAVGHIDPGAQSMAIMFSAFSQAIEKEEATWQTEMETH